MAAAVAAPARRPAPLLRTAHGVVMVRYDDLVGNADLSEHIRVRRARCDDCRGAALHSLIRLPGPSSFRLAHRTQEGFGDLPHCLGLLVVSGVPDYVDRRRRLLPLAAKYAALPDSVKARHTSVASNFSVGWSHGKEKFNGILGTLPRRRTPAFRLSTRWMCRGGAKGGRAGC